tara:strand:+ start:121 stop:519 length:399 start_codon:yes stop_codon:yes gene_type:complete
MLFKKLLLAVFLIFPSASIAHSPLASSSPQDGETLNVPLTEIVMHFESPAKLIKVDLRKQPSTLERSLFDGIFGSNKGEVVTLGTDFLLTINKRQLIPLPALEDGSYSFSWRAMGEDSHVIKGNLTFNIKVN